MTVAGWNFSDLAEMNRRNSNPKRKIKLVYLSKGTYDEGFPLYKYIISFGRQLIVIKREEEIRSVVCVNRAKNSGKLDLLVINVMKFSTTNQRDGDKICPRPYPRLLTRLDMTNEHFLEDHPKIHTLDK